MTSRGVLVVLLATLATLVPASLGSPAASAAGAGNSITTPDANAFVGRSTELVLDESGNPVVAYYDYGNADLKLLHCNDANCAGGDDSITTPDTGNVNGHLSLTLDAAGAPVVSYIANNNLTLLHCNDPNCVGGGDSINSPDDEGNSYTSLKLDASGSPVISYRYSVTRELKVVHCNDTACAGGDESIEVADVAGVVGTLGLYSSLALDASGNPVVSYYDDTFGDLKLLALQRRELRGWRRQHHYA